MRAATRAFYRRVATAAHRPFAYQETRSRLAQYANERPCIYTRELRKIEIIEISHTHTH